MQVTCDNNVTGWLVDWLVGWLVGWMDGWMDGWLDSVGVGRCGVLVW